MESTGVYWKPVYNILEGDFEILLANARHLKNVPGHKTDEKDSLWIAELYAHGLLKASFVPNIEQRGLRELTRTRSTFVAQRAQLANRIQKQLEDANIKLSSVATDILGVSGRAMLRQIIQGEQDVAKVANLAQRSMRKKIPELKLALAGRVRPHHRLVLKELLDQVESLDGTITRLNAAIVAAMAEATDPFEQAVSILESAPGVSEVSVRGVLAEMGTNMSQYASSAHLCSWAGSCPGNNQSGGKRLSGKTTHGNRWLMALLVQIAQGAVKVKTSYCYALYKRLSARRGKKRAIVAVANSLLTSFYHMLKNGCPYEDLGANYFDRKDKDRTVKRILSRLGSLGYEATLKEVAVAE
jgi:transposase